MSRRSRRVAALVPLLVLAGALPAAAQSPSPVAASPVPAPVLTFGPLVTLPPVTIAADRLAGIPQDGYVLGDPAAPVTIEAWEDFQCPYCLRWTAQVEPQLIDAYVRPGIAKLVYRPLSFIGEESRWAAVAADLAAEQDRFWLFHDQLYSNQLGENIGSYSLDRLVTMAQNAGLDMGPWLDGMQLDQARARYAALDAASRADAGALGINATPSIVVNGSLVEVPDFESISAAVAEAVGVAGSSPATSPAAPAIPSTGPSASPAS